jgi:hypothetical protein
MTRSWISFGFGVMLLASPVRLWWAHAGARANAVFLAWGALVLLGFWLARERRP